MRPKAQFLLLFFVFALAALAFADDSSSASAASPNSEFSYKFRKGGSFSLEPAILIPYAPLDTVLNNALGYNADFDIGVSPDISLVFGAGYYNLQGQQNPDYYLTMAPLAGIKSKNQFLPMVELFWELDVAGYYEKSYLIQSSTGSEENLDAGGILGGGFDVWWTRWLLTGIDVRFHLVYEDQRVYPFSQFGLRIGIRG